MGKRVFSRLLKDKRNLIGAEIGVFRAGHACALLEDLDIKKIYLVDPYERYPEYEASVEISDNLKTARKEAKERLKQLNYSSKVVWMIKHSMEAVKEIEDGSLDFVYIDGNHAYEFVKQDIEHWSKKVKRGGLVGGHDYDDRYGVIPAVDEFVKRNKIGLESEGIEWWYWKK